MASQLCFFALATVGSGLRLPPPGVGTLPRMAVGSASPIHLDFDPLGLHGSQRTAQLAARSAGALAGAFPMLICVGRAGAASSNNLDADAVKRAIVNAAMVRSRAQSSLPNACMCCGKHHHAHEALAATATTFPTASGLSGRVA